MKTTDLPAQALALVPHLAGKLDGLELPEPAGWNLLVLQYQRPEKVGNIYLADQTRQEDKYQGRVGIIIAAGPDAFSDPNRFPAGPRAGVGDVISWPANANAASRIEYGGCTFAILPDTSIQAVWNGCDLGKVGG